MLIVVSTGSVLAEHVIQKRNLVKGMWEKRKGQGMVEDLKVSRRTPFFSSFGSYNPQYSPVSGLTTFNIPLPWVVLLFRALPSV